MYYQNNVTSQQSPKFSHLPSLLQATAFFCSWVLNQTFVSSKNSSIHHLCEKEVTRFPPPSQSVVFLFPSHSDKIHALVCVLKKYISIFILRIAQIIYLKKMSLFIFYCLESFQSWPILASQYPHLLFFSLPFHVYMKRKYYLLQFSL